MSAVPKPTEPVQQNPLLAPWQSSHGLPPFDAIRAEHFVPAFTEAMQAHREEVDALATNSEPANFENTVAAFDRCGRLLGRIEPVFRNLCGSRTSEQLQAVQRQIAPKLALHFAAIHQDRRLFGRFDALHRQRHQLKLTDEQVRLVERFHLDFVKQGAQLQGEPARRFSQIVERLAVLTTQFGQNVLADEADYRLVLRTPDDAAGLPDFVLTAAREAAQARGIDDAHVITLARSMAVPFLTFSERRDLREQFFRARIARGEGEGARDNRPLVREILALRLEQAQLLGHSSYADFALTDRMAGTPRAVLDLLQQVWTPATARATRERAALEAMAAGCGHVGAIEPWDWYYYAEKVRRARYDLDEAQIKPYFSLDRMIEAAFDSASRLFGLRFTPVDGVPVYHPDVRAWEVRKTDGALVGLFLGDYFARPSKRSGAWMSALRWQSKNGEKCGESHDDTGGGTITPIILNNCNFAQGAPGTPTLLGLDDVRTLFHEFGHGLHGLLSNVTYERLSGTRVLRDFVELPSQIFEHWGMEPDVLKRHARHVQTDAPISDALLARIDAARGFNQGFEAVMYTSSALLDMALHMQTSYADFDATAFERAELARLGMPQGVPLMHRPPHFQHLFQSDAYAAGYYVYMWAEVLDEDGYQAFREAGDPFDAPTAARLLQFIYSTGDAREPRAAYRAFRGRDAVVHPMLASRGLVETADVPA